MMHPSMNLTRKTGSLNNFMSLSGDLPPETARRTVSNQSINKGSLSQTLAHRPFTPAVQRASDDHVSRIRAANARGGLKEKLKVIVPPPPSTRLRQSRASDSSNSESDVESVHWTAPLDIMSSLYKPEYDSRPGSVIGKWDGTVGSHWRGDTGVVNGTQPKCSLPLVPPENSRSTKDAMVQSYVTRSKSSRLCPRHEITDYKDFIRKLNDDLRSTSAETMRLDRALPRTWTRKQNKPVGFHEGYLAIKQMYLLNPALAESAAKKHICGPAGTHWMGLSRVETLEVLRQIRKELDVPVEMYQNEEKRMSFNRTEVRIKVPRKKRKARKKTKRSPRPRERKPRSRKLTPLLLQHVPGPKHLHTNICIQPWEPDLDGLDSDTDATEASLHESEFSTEIVPKSPSKDFSNQKIPELSESKTDKSQDDDFVVWKL